VAGYINKMPTPFLTRSAPAGKGAPADKGPAAPDKAAVLVPPRTEEKADKAVESKPRFDFYKILPGSEEPVSEQQFKDAQQKASTAKSSETFFLQAGAFQSAPDADNLK